jgi:hypothetical protein
MIVIHYDELPCDHYKVEIKRADFDITQHEEIGDIQRLTGSEHYILRILQAIRSGVLRTDDIVLYCQDTLMEVGIKGEFLSPWPTDLFEADFYLRFNDYPQEK